MAIATNLGFPRIGRRRELKTALESFWAGRSDEAALLAEAARLRDVHWAAQQAAGIGHIPAGEFALYDHVLDTACMVGAIPPGYGWEGGKVSLATYFALARGVSHAPDCGCGAHGAALEMTKWFDTNYHYLVPQLSRDTRFALTENRPRAAFREALAANRRTRPVLLGPVTFLLLSKTTDGSDPLDLLDRLLPVYAEILAGLEAAGAGWVQIDEPALVLDLPAQAQAAFPRAYAALREAAPKLDLLLATYFGALGDNLATALALPVSGLHVDLVRAPEQLDAVVAGARADQTLSLGVVDGRNVWRTDLAAAHALLRRAADARGARQIMVAPSCSLLHVPVDLAQETGLDPVLAGGLAFATQKLKEIATLARALDEGADAVRPEFEAAAKALAALRDDPRRNDTAVAARLAAVAPAMARRATPHGERRQAQQARLKLPAYPTTTIGSFPQTAEVRAARAKAANDPAAYEAAIAGWIAETVRWQEQVGLDVLVHGEFERNDMVKYFGELLAGYAFTKHGWVQSYGSRCVAPPIIWGDVSRPEPMTVRWTQHAQSLTDRPMKGMLTGPVTMLQWSFVRTDLPRSDVCRQIALALRDEVSDLETAGIAVIQVDEPAFREGLPLRRADRAAYLAWATECFRLATSGVADATAIHTHMCYSEFGDILDAIAALDADAISIETARSRMELLEAFAGGAYPNEIGPGVWDIHSPRVPDAAEMTALLRLARERLAPWQIWVNPDCGLKTRRWEEVRPAIANMVEAARALRAEAA